MLLGTVPPDPRRWEEGKRATTLGWRFAAAYAKLDRLTDLIFQGSFRRWRTS
jgi:hypothetical protein